jgi:hypothetical protein
LSALQSIHGTSELLKEAILDYLAARPEGASSAQMMKDLGLKEVYKGKPSDKLLWGLHNLLIAEGKIRIDRKTSPQRWHLTEQ